MRLSAVFLAACAAWCAAANEVCVEKKTGELTTSAFLVAEVETASKGARCFRLDDVPVVKPHFLHPIHAWRSFTGQPWYNYMLIAWILTAVQKYFS